jgi:hypothetical protein
MLSNYNLLTLPTLDAVILSGEHMKLGIYEFELEVPLVQL